jgi:hypothetical protein
MKKQPPAEEQRRNMMAFLPAATLKSSIKPKLSRETAILYACFSYTMKKGVFLLKVN